MGAVELLSSVLPAPVVAVACVSDDDAGPLHPSEEPAVERAVESRRAEFTTGRSCARSALASLGAPVAAVPVGEKRAPVWPDGVVGSITHTRGFRGAAVAWRSVVRSVGIDAEAHDALPDGVLDAVSSESERAGLARLSAASPEVSWDRLLFSAKESVYKTWFPLTGRWLGFEEAELEPSPDGTFLARLLVQGPVVDGAVVSSFSGRWAVEGGILVTAIALPAR
ncbi:4'-phosphopantetheinyl transferase superfamily protein [Actinomycetospora endophytica]|uniref:4'-phosphopantetheinyl transferase superfamily protein n=1 Tax=Actinomycetospora endophytica TaxID=2291215 RepID=A0ABS8PH16_9PSEU|nr:4'-phosphopantetheinyl transferase superfamily protein [Actinomycetospora endophytica]MCD2196284.1 4'-phosphopantetheinyl transferase superfamily protein [Actinomycetospora endophytica]